MAGTCEPVGYCSFPDPSCAEGWRFGDFAADFSRRCVGDLGDAGLVDTPPGFHRVGGTVSGLDVPSSPLVLRNNGGDDLATSVNGGFTFAAPLAEGASYDVSVAILPTNKACTAIDATGVIGLTDVTSVIVQCGSDGGRSIDCNPTSNLTCAGAQNCCTDASAANGFCQDASAACDPRGELKVIHCDDAGDCGGTAVCCAEYVMGKFKGSSCVSSCGGSENEIWCDPAVVNSCPVGTCSGTALVGSGRFAKCQQ